MVRLIFLLVLSSGSLTYAASSGTGVGLNVGIGVPFLTQAGVNIRFTDRLGLSVAYNLLDIEVGDASAELSMPEALLMFHPFSGSFFIGAGIGQEKLEVSATETIDGDKIAIEVEAMTTVVKVGWMWGIEDGGFWSGIDFSYITPSSPEMTTTAPGVVTTDASYQDAVDAAEKFGETSYFNITFLRLGYFF